MDTIFLAREHCLALEHFEQGFRSFCFARSIYDETPPQAAIRHAREVRVKRELDNLVVQMYASGITYDEAVREFRRRYIQEVLGHHRGNQCKAAKELGVHRNTLSRIMADLQMDPAQIKLGLKRPPRSERPFAPPVQLVRSK